MDDGDDPRTNQALAARLADTPKEGSNMAQATNKAMDEATRRLRRVRALGRKILQGRDAEAQGKATVADVREEFVALATDLGLDVVECAPGRGVQVVRPVRATVTDADALVAAIVRHRPDMADALAPRKVDVAAVSAAIEHGTVPDTWRRYIEHVDGTVQVRATKVKGGPA